MNANRQELAQTLFEEAGDALFLFDPEDGRLIEVNPMAQRLCGLSRPALLEESIKTLFRSEVQGGVARLRRAYQVTGLFHSQDGFFLRQKKDGGWLPVNLTVARLHMKPKTLGLITARDVSERRRSEAALRESEARHQAVVDSALDCIITIDHQGTIVEFNPAAERVFGYAREEALGRPLAQLIIPAASREAHVRGLAHYLTTGEGPMLGRRVEVAALRADGTEFPVELTITAIRSKGEPVFTAFLRDVTMRKQAEIALGERARQASLAGDVGVALTQGDSMQEMLGLCAASLVRHLDGAVVRIWTLNADGDAPELQASAGLRTDPDGEHGRVPAGQFEAGRIAAEGQPYFTNAVAGDPEWAAREGVVAFAGYPLFVADRLVGVAALFARRRLVAGDSEALAAMAGPIALGIDRKRAEGAQRSAEQRLQHVVSSSPVVLFTLAIKEGRIRGVSWVSDNLLAMLGYSPEDAASRYWWIENIHPEDREAVMAQTQQQLFAWGRTSQEYRFRHRDGTYRWTRVEIRLAGDAAGWGAEAVGSWSDVTERRQLEEQFRQSQKMEAFGQLAGGVAHDFNNLLTIINGYSSLLLECLPPDDPSRDALGEIQKAGERSAGLTRQLLAFSRRQVLAPRVLDLNAVIANADKMLGRVIGEDVALVTTLDDALGTVRADSGQVEQILLNLAVNARDAMPTGGRLEIETRNVELDDDYARSHPDARPGPHILLAVADTGCGMSPEVKAKIFEPFFTTKGPGKGTGLGLATVYGIVRQSGGHIEVHSEAGVGTVFQVYLPREQTPTDAKFRSGPPAAPRGTETVLLVEDEDGVRALIRRVLTGCGYTVLEAAEMEEAVRVAAGRPEPIDLLVSDVVMPGGGGRAVADRVSELHPSVRVLFVSGYTDDTVVRHGVLQDGMYFLQKPFSPIALAHKVREVLDSGSQTSRPEMGKKRRQERVPVR